MLVIRREQMEVFKAARWREFASLAASHCRQRHPEACSPLDDEALQSRVDSGLRRARSHGFDQPPDLMRYLDMLFTIDPEADKEPWVAAILAQSKYSPATRMDLIFRTAGETAESSPVKPEAPAGELPDATWPEPKPGPAPPPYVLVPPDAHCLLRPPWEESGDNHSG